MDNELEVIRDEMEQTRANLANKLGALENQVRETVSGATEAVSSTVEGVKGVVSSVSETVESVTETFNVSRHVEQHPWVAMGAAVAAGFVAAQILNRMTQPAPAPPAPMPPPDLPLQPVAHAPPATYPAPQPAERHEEKKEPGSILSSLESMMPDMSGVVNTVASSLGGLAVGGLMGVIREMAASGLPQEWRGEVTKLVDQVAQQLGGQPLDSTRSNQILGALGFGQGGQNQGGQHSGEQARDDMRQEGAPFDPAKQQGAQASSSSGEQPGNASRGYRGARNQATQKR